MSLVTNEQQTLRDCIYHSTDILRVWKTGTISMVGWNLLAVEAENVKLAWYCSDSNWEENVCGCYEVEEKQGSHEVFEICRASITRPGSLRQSDVQ